MLELKITTVLLFNSWVDNIILLDTHNWVSDACWIIIFRVDTEAKIQNW